MRKQRRAKFFICLAIVLAVISGSVIGGYFIIDRCLVPQYFAKYGINNLKELVDIASTIYSTPNESDFITNPFTKADKTSAENLMIEAGFPRLVNGGLDYEKIGKGKYTLTPSEDFNQNYIFLTDRQSAGILNETVETGVLVSNSSALSYLGSDLTYLDTLKMSIKQFIITPIFETEEDTSTNSARLVVTIKIDTSTARTEISQNLQTPKFLIDWIIPSSIYLTGRFEIMNAGTKDQSIEHALLAINSKTPKQSEVLLKLLMEFIYPNQTDLTIESFTASLGDLVLTGLASIGKFEFTTEGKSNGVKIFLDNAER